jgi:3',5'-cyclic-AMP phosphodiesterase
MKFLHLTDTHLVPPGQMLYGLDPRFRLDLAVSDIKLNHADAAFCVVTGDLAHRGEEAAYAQLCEALSALPMRRHLLIGNHDHRGRFLAAFPETPTDADGFVQSAFDTEIGRFILLDTNEPDVHWGVICARRRAWLGRQLDRAAVDDRRVYLFMHHPPFPVGLKRMDEISLREPDAFAAVVRPHARRIRHLFFGHLHRPVAGSWLGIPVSTLRGTNHQVALDFAASGGVPGSHEPPEYGVVLADPACTIVHMHNYLDRTATFTL